MKRGAQWKEQSMLRRKANDTRQRHKERGGNECVCVCACVYVYVRVCASLSFCVWTFQSLPHFNPPVVYSDTNKRSPRENQIENQKGDMHISVNHGIITWVCPHSLLYYTYTVHRTLSQRARTLEYGTRPAFSPAACRTAFSDLSQIFPVSSPNLVLSRNEHLNKQTERAETSEWHTHIHIHRGHTQTHTYRHKRTHTSSSKKLQSLH